MTKYKSAFLDYYGEHEISPVSQDISDLGAHFARREALYCHLGVIPSFVKGKTVLEFGPGSGHNALYTASLGPERYVLVDGNSKGVEETRERLAGCSTEVVVVESLIEDFDADDLFDIVLCEGAIPWQVDPAGILKSVSRFVAPGGILIMTCIDEVSNLADTLRRLEAAMVLSEEEDLEVRVAKLLPLFKKDLQSLAGMSRPHRDWILDQILQPFIGNFFSLESAIATLDDGFKVYGSSPRFFLDWTWYKEVPIRPLSDNELGIRNYRKNLHNLMDYRYEFPPRSEADNMRLFELVDQITRTALQFENSKDTQYLTAVRDSLGRLAEEVESFSPGTAASLSEFRDGMTAFLGSGTFPVLTDFAPFFGRGQQYLCFVRKSAMPVCS